jgi:hypothetical protein
MRDGRRRWQAASAPRIPPVPNFAGNCRGLCPTRRRYGFSRMSPRRRRAADQSRPRRPSLGKLEHNLCLSGRRRAFAQLLPRTKSAPQSARCLDQGMRGGGRALRVASGPCLSAHGPTRIYSPACVFDRREFSLAEARPINDRAGSVEPALFVCRRGNSAAGADGCVKKQPASRLSGHAGKTMRREGVKPPAPRPPCGSARAGS